MRKLSIFSLGLFLLAGAAWSSPNQALSARQIVDQMLSVYASCSSYLDEGEVRAVFLDQRFGRRTDVKPFSTAFLRPANFRYEYRSRRGEEEWDRFIIWQGAGSVKIWRTLEPGGESPQDLSLAIASAAGVSGGSSALIPSLLMPDLGDFLQTLSELKLVGEEKIGGRDAYKIEGKARGSYPVALWVDKESLLIVKFFHRDKFERFELETTTTYKPQVNVEIAHERLAFDPPVRERREPR